MSTKRLSPISWLMKFAARLRFPQLFALTGVVFLADLFIPDVIPFIDEVMLGLITALLGSLRTGNEPDPETDKRPD